MVWIRAALNFSAMHEGRVTLSSLKVSWKDL